MRNVEKWKDVKNLPFHAWMRNPANKTKVGFPSFLLFTLQVFVESYKTPNTGEHNWSSLTKVVCLVPIFFLIDRLKWRGRTIATSTQSFLRIL